MLKITKAELTAVYRQWQNEEAETIAVIEAVGAYLDGERINRGLTNAEQLAQGARCGCRGSDDYCVCQNVPDSVTQASWAAEASPTP